MKKLFLFTTALAASISLNAQFAKFDGIAVAETEAEAKTAGTVLATTDAFVASVAFDDNYKTVNLKHEGFGWWEIDGANVNAAVDTLGLQGATNPKDADGFNPANACTVPAGGAVFQVYAKADGYLFIFHKASSNKQYMVEENGIPVGYHFGMVTTDVNGYFGEAGATKVIEYTIEGNNDLGQITDGRKIMLAEDYVKQENDTNIGIAVYRRNGLGVISVPCYKGCTYWFHTTGSKMSAIGVAYYPVDKDVYAVNEDGTKVQIYTQQAEVSTTYYIAGNDEALFGSVWEPNGCMLEKQADGTYAKSFTNCIPGHRYQFKITNGSWEYNWGCNSVLEPSFIACESNGNINVIPATSNLKVIFDPTTELITVEGELYQEPKYNVTLRGIDLYGYYQYIDSWGDISDVWFDDRTEISFTIESGLSVRITEEGYCGTWLGWSDGNTEKNSRTITITSDTVITSLFDVPTYQVNISAAEHGSLTRYGEPIGNIETTMTDCGSDGEWIDICVVPDDGYYLAGWSDGYAYVCRSIKVVSDTTLVAHFAEKQQVQVLVGVESACKNMGTVSGSGIFYQGDVVTITATPNEGYHFVEWSDGNSIANRDIYITSDTTLFATFSAGDMGGKCGDNLYWTWDNGALTITGSGDMDLSTHPAWWQYEEMQITSVSMPEGMTSIDAWAFYGQPITTILIPASVEEVGDRAFADNNQLTHFEYIGNNIHWGIENSYWDYRPLYGCYNLQYFRGNKDLLTWNDSYAQLDTVIVSNGEAWDDLYYQPYVDNTNAYDEELWGNPEAYVKTIQTLYLPAGLVVIGDYALHNARFLDGITIPEGVTRIGISAFEDCRSMDSVVFAGNNVEEIGAWAFYNCHSLRSLTLPEGVEEIGRAAFFDCTYLNELTLPSTMKKIADNGFAGCEKLGTMYVNALVPPTIEAKTFEDVDRATPIFVPKGTLERYQADEYWSEFFNMAEYEAPSGNLNTNADEANGLRKVVRNGQVLILRGDKTYNMMGQELSK